MFDHQIESASNKLIQFLQELTLNIQTISQNNNSLELFQLCSDYAKQLACLFNLLINKLIEEYQRNQRNIHIQLNLDPVQIWRLIQSFIDQLNQLQWENLNLILKSMRSINKYFYNLLLQIKNIEYLKIDQTRTINENLTLELNNLSESLKQFITTYYQPQSHPTNTYLSHEPIQNSFSTSPINTNCYPCTTTNNLPQQNPCFQSYMKPIQDDGSLPLCFPTPIVYTPEMEALFSSGGIIYARKSENTWIAENLGRLLETVKDISETIDMHEHYDILVRKTGELFVRRKRGHHKRLLRRNLNNEQADSSDDEDQ